MITRITVVGLNELLRDIKRADPAVAKGLRIAGNKAVQFIVEDSKARVPTRKGKAKGSIKGRSTQKLVRVQAGGSRAPYFGFLDFGNVVHHKSGVGRNDTMVRPFERTGRYVWKSFADNRIKLLKAYEEAVAKAIDDAGLDVT